MGAEKPVNSDVDNGLGVAPISLGDQAYAKIKKAIIIHELEGGERVSENSLVDLFGLSRAAVRHAIARLTSERFITLKSSKTQIVAPLTLETIRSVFQLRNLLEPEAARRAAGKVDKAKLLEFNRLCEADYQFGNKDAEYEFLSANRQFHLYIAEASGNPFLQEFLEQLQDHAMRILWYSLKIENRPKVWRHGHSEIIEALLSGDGETAAKMAEGHLLAGQTLIYEVLSMSRELNSVPLG